MFRAVTIRCLALLVAMTTLTAQSASEPAYVIRGRQTEVRQRAFKDRLERFHDALATALKRDAPELLAKLDPPPQPSGTGYQLLPRIVADAPPKPPEKPQVVSFYWGWSDTLYARETTSLEKLEGDLKAAAGTMAAPYEALIAGYRKTTAARRLIDSDVGYNWLWQREITNNPARFDVATRLIDEAVALQAKSAPLTAEIFAGTSSITPPAFVRIERPAAHQIVVVVPIYTDITDDEFLDSFKLAVERHWQVRSGDDEYRVRLDLERMPTDRLYCGAGTSVGSEACEVPQKGQPVDLARHVALFPLDRAVLTTGADTLHVAGGRAIALAQFEVGQRGLAHELGHLLGFPDQYLRGYRNLGGEGLRVLEFVADPSDIMSSPGSGSVLDRHFQRLMDAKNPKL